MSENAYPLRYFMPLLEEADGTFRPPDHTQFSMQDIPLVDELNDFIRRNFEPTTGIVEILHNLYETKIYRPRHGSDYWFTVVDESWKPVEQNSVHKENINSECDLSFSWVGNVEYSESISPPESIFISDSFIEPDFDEVDIQGNLRGSISWHSLIGMPRVIIIGPPGAGKTTTLRRIALEHLDRWKEENTSPFPVYIQMRHFHQSVRVEKIINDSVFGLGDHTGGSTNSIDIAKKNILLILDGLDETPEAARDNASATIQRFTEQNRVISVIASTREAGYHWKLPHFRYVRIKPFTKEKIQEWTFYRIKSELREEWLRFITSLEENSPLERLYGNPLLLSICVSLYRRNSVLPQNRSALLKNYFDAIVEQWDAVIPPRLGFDSWRVFTGRRT